MSTKPTEINRSHYKCPWCGNAFQREGDAKETNCHKCGTLAEIQLTTERPNESTTPRFAALHTAFLAKDGFSLHDIVEAHELCEELETVLAAQTAENARLREALEKIIGMQPMDEFQFPGDWSAQIASCPECQGWAKNHPIQQGICDEHRKPLYEKEKYEKNQRLALPYRMKAIAAAALEGE
jgi:hypothetical protein